MPFACSICEQESTRICACCTKDSCDNHLCERCGCCSDCCECDVPLDEVAVHPHVAPVESEPAATLSQAEPPVAPELADAIAQPELVQPETPMSVPDEPSAELPETPEV